MKHPSTHVGVSASAGISSLILAQGRYGIPTFTFCGAWPQQTIMMGWLGVAVTRPTVPCPDNFGIISGRCSDINGTIR